LYVFVVNAGGTKGGRRTVPVLVPVTVAIVGDKAAGRGGPGAATCAGNGARLVTSSAGLGAGIIKHTILSTIIVGGTLDPLKLASRVGTPLSRGRSVGETNGVLVDFHTWRTVVVAITTE